MRAMSHSSVMAVVQLMHFFVHSRIVYWLRKGQGLLLLWSFGWEMSLLPLGWKASEAGHRSTQPSPWLTDKIQGKVL